MRNELRAERRLSLARNQAGRAGVRSPVRSKNRKALESLGYQRQDGTITPKVATRGAVIDWARMLAYVTGTVDQELLARNEYLTSENRILKAVEWTLEALGRRALHAW
jgi:hypothetical protein